MSPGGRELVVDVSGHAIELADLPPDVAARLSGFWDRFLVPAAARKPLLRIRCDDRAGGVAAADDRFVGDATALRVEPGVHATGFRLTGGHLALEPDGSARLVLDAREPLERHFTVMNLILPAFAWAGAASGLAIVHAAAAVLDGTAVLLPGTAGSGKSTWLRAAVRAGASPLSDDLVIVDGNAAKPALLASPFRSQEYGSSGPARHPLGLLLVPRRAAAPTLGPLSALRARSAIVANLPWLTDGALPAALERLLDRLTGEVPLRTLSFNPGGSWVPLVRAALADGTARP